MRLKQEYIFFGLAGITAVIVVVIVLREKLPAIAAEPKVDLSVFDSPDQPGSGRCMDKRFIAMLVRLQRETGYPIFRWINSGARTSYWNAKVGGVANSAHKIPVCKAADIRTSSKDIQRKLVAAARRIGFKRIGIGKTFVHLDIDNTKVQYVAWGYPKGQKPPFNPFG